MKIVNRPRQGGKTTDLLHRMIADKRLVYVAPTIRRAQDAWERARQIDPDIDRGRFIGVLQLPTARNLTQHHELVVDELEDVLYALGIRQRIAVVAGSFEVAA